MKCTNDLTAETKIIFAHMVNISNTPYLLIFGKCHNQGFLCAPEYYITCTIDLSVKSADSNIKRLESGGFSNKIATEIISYLNNWMTG